jgi:alpha-galactosidase
MKVTKIVIVGAGSRSFGPAMIDDVLLSDALCQGGVELALMDIDFEGLSYVKGLADAHITKLNRSGQVKIKTFLDLCEALQKADFVISMVERNRNLYWSQDYHIPRKYGFNQIYGENGGPGGAFHGLRNFPLVVDIAKKMEQFCPEAILMNLSNPESRIIDAVSALTNIKAYGFCHGVSAGKNQVADFLGKPVNEIDFVVGGINHFVWFLKITDKETGKDLYPALHEADKKIAPAYGWRTLGLPRLLFKRTGLWPMPGTDHCGEYIGWAHEFVDNSLEFIYDPESEPKKTVTEAPQFIYLGFDNSAGADPTEKKYPDEGESENITGIAKPEDEKEMSQSGELLIPFIEAIVCDKSTRLTSLVVPNKGYIPNLPDNQGVEVPVEVNGQGVTPETVGPLPEYIAAMCRLQMSIQQLLLEAYIEKSKAKLIQAILLEPTVSSYKSAIAMINEFLERQKDVLPEFH